MTFSFVKASELRVGDFVHRSTGMHEVHKIENEDGWLTIYLDWLKYPNSTHPGFDVSLYHPDCEFLKQKR